VNGDVSTPRSGWWMILLYFAGCILAGLIIGFVVVGVAWLFGWF
jgi:hypothetical protein